MPPKKKQQQKESKKSEQKKKDKIIEDKTFGMKNKKGNKQQKFIQRVNQQVKSGGDPIARKAEQQRLDEKKRKEEEKKKKTELDDLFKPVLFQKIAAGADPKSVLCVFFKQGLCHKGDKCKFSHNLAIERKGAKRNMYDEELEKDTMDNWDDDKLKEVVEKKHGNERKQKQKQKTDIVCKHFIQAVEDKKYGWFWTCPVGANCIYKHALPPGFVLKSDKKKMAEQEEKITIEELIEKERAALGANVTRVTLTSFLAWKKKKRADKLKALFAEKSKRQKNVKSGKLQGISGRELFEFRPDMVGEDADDATDDVKYEADPETAVDDDKAFGVTNNMFVPMEIDTSHKDLSKASDTRFKYLEKKKPAEPSETPETAATEETPPSTSNGVTTDDQVATETTAEAEIEVDENLFDGGDLDDLDAELEGLDV